MSFHDLTKNFITLSAQDLFKHRVKNDVTIPSRGGQKDFEPDGSWIQSKAVEVFIQEKTSVLGEPRVEKLKNLVQGTWEAEKNLINVEKTGKFWAHMGFTDKRRNWLYPEEALFLMETNSLEVYECGVPLSIQEAYNKFLQGSEIGLTEYQVFAHLRRLGFVVLRHEGPVLTAYEKQINLDKYISKRSLKERKSKLKKKKKGRQEDESSTLEEPQNLMDATEKNQSQGLSTEKEGAAKDQVLQNTPGVKEEDKHAITVAEKRSMSENDESSQVTNKKLCVGSTKDSPSDLIVNSSTLENTRFYSDGWSDCLKSDVVYQEDSSNAKNVQPAWGCEEISAFPDIGGKDSFRVENPKAALVPPNIEVSEKELFFDVEGYRLKQPQESLSRQAQREVERDSRVRALEFSFAEWTQRRPKVRASSWADYKEKVAKRLQDMASETPVSHLWHGEVTPLLHPSDASSYGAILDKLGIIQSVANEDLCPKSQAMEISQLKITFDVHLPDHRFKKSMPGVPNHRVCITQCATEPPGLAQIQECWHKYKDGVPLHWAVVDSGEIAFYVFDNASCIKPPS